MGSLKWAFVTLIFVAALALVLGSDLSKTDLLNFNTSVADMRAKDQATNARTQKDAIDLKVYQAQQDAKIAEQQQAIALQATKAVADQQTYLAQQMAQAAKQVADAKQYEAQQQTQAEVSREQQLAEVRAWELSQTQQQAQAQARDEQSIEFARSLGQVIVEAIRAVSIALAMGIIVLTVARAWTRLHRVQQSVKVSGTTSGAQPQSVPDATPNLEIATPKLAVTQRANHMQWKEKIIQARANEITLRSAQIHPDLLQGSVRPKYQDLPLAVMKDNLTNGDSDPRGRSSSS